MTATTPPAHESHEKPTCCQRATVGDALIAAGAAFAGSWISPLKEPLKWKRQFFYALAGAYLWLFVNLSSDVLSGTFEIFDSASWLILATIGVNLLGGLFFAWIITYGGRRRCSPGRLFIDGLLLPGITAGLVEGSVLVRSLTALTGGQPQ